MDKLVVLNSVQDQYGAVARSGLSNESKAVRSVAQVFGYTEEELASLPPQANMGLSCGNPVALAGLREGEVVVDLGCGGGLDVRKKAQTAEERTMKTIQVYDKPMCCSTGVCGPQVDPVLPRFAADLDWLKTQGHRVERYNLAQQPQEFIQNVAVHQLLSTEGTDCLPLIVVDGQIVNRAMYPSRAMLSRWTESPVETPAAADCCGGAAKDSANACCAEDEQAKAAGNVGCGCKDSVSC